MMMATCDNNPSKHETLSYIVFALDLPQDCLDIVILEEWSLVPRMHRDEKLMKCEWNDLPIILDSEPVK